MHGPINLRLSVLVRTEISTLFWVSASPPDLFYPTEEWIVRVFACRRCHQALRTEFSFLTRREMWGRTAPSGCDGDSIRTGYGNEMWRRTLTAVVKVIQVVGYEDNPAGKYEYWLMSLFLNVLDHEKRDEKPLRNFSKYLPVNTAPYPKRRKSFELYDAQFVLFTRVSHSCEWLCCWR
jgi:hypothetical protein